MLDPWVIEEILRREKERVEESSQPFLEAPVPPQYQPEDRAKPAEESNRGIVIIDIV